MIIKINNITITAHKVIADIRKAKSFVNP